MALVTEDQVEQLSIDWFKELGYQYKCGYDIAPDGEEPERTDYRSTVLKDRLQTALIRINPDISRSAINTTLSHWFPPSRAQTGSHTVARTYFREQRRL